MVAQKFWLAPSLAAKYQSNLPTLKTARGMLLVQVTRRGLAPVVPPSNAEVEAFPIWFTPLDQPPLLPADDKLAAARADEVDRRWDEAAKKYDALLQSSTLDSHTRAVALSRYEYAREMMHQWWWQTPLIRWFYIHGPALLYTGVSILAVVLALLFLRFTRITVLWTVLKRMLVPGYRGQARINLAKQLTPSAPADEFRSQMLFAGEEIRSRLRGEKETWAARHIPLLVPSFSDYQSLATSVPKIGTIDLSVWVQFLIKLATTFQWTVDAGIAIMQPNVPPASTTGMPPDVPVGGMVTGVAVLQWGWATKKTWLRSKDVTDRSAMRDVARQLTELVAGEAFLQARGRKFSAAESFLLFMEGIRELQLYDDQASIAAPLESVLKQHLEATQGFLRDCVSTYPTDVLPRYYLGIVYTYHAQVEQARYFQNLLSNGNLTPRDLIQLPPRTKYYLERAVQEFHHTAIHASGDVKLYALFNQAQALAKLDENQ